MHGIKSDFLAGHPKNKRLTIVLDNQKKFLVNLESLFYSNIHNFFTNLLL